MMGVITPGGTNSGAVRLLCTCPEHGGKRETVGKFFVREGLEVKSRHHGTYHIGSISAPDLLRHIAGTVDGSAIVTFVRQQLGL